MPDNPNAVLGYTPSGRLVAQRGLFRGPDLVCPLGLYAGVPRGAATRARARLTVHPHSTVTTDAYFGRFPASYWQRWTAVERVEVELRATGSGLVSVVASDVTGQTRVVAAHQVAAAGGAEVRFPVRLDRFVDGGFLWLEFATDDDELVVEQLRWTVEPPERPRPTAVVICTFNRADDCVNTLEHLTADAEVLTGLDAVYVVDQGDDPVSSRAGFAGVTARLGGRLRYLRQPNLGGAGGFGRGMYEVTEASHAEHANVLLMDDDVLCEPEVVIRLGTFANCTVKPAIIGGQMLRLFHPTVLHVGAEHADFANLLPGQVPDGGLEDADLLGEEVDEDGLPTGRPNRGDRRVDAGYTGWWACLIPSEAIADIGYPLPLFLQWDDIEYGYRARAAGYPTVTLPGAALWHADFQRKDWDAWSHYFALRNAMITTALHAEVDLVQTARVLVSRIVRYLISMQYGLAATVIKAAEDYLEGPAILADGGANAAAEIRKLRAEYPDTVVHPASDVPRLGGVQLVAGSDKPSLARSVLVKRLLQIAFGRTETLPGALAAADAEWWHVSRFDTVVVTDASQEGVRVRTRDRATMLALLRRTATVIRRLLSDGRRLRSEYRAAAPQLASRENWKHLYRL